MGSAFSIRSRYFSIALWLTVLYPVVAKLKAFIRSPTWIAPSQGFVDPKNEGPKNFYYTQEEKKAFRENPDKFLEYRKRIESDMNRTFDTFLKDSPKQQAARVVGSDLEPHICLFHANYQAGVRQTHEEPPGR